jgi:hypothetical protein
VKLISLSQGLQATVDDADYEPLMQWKWSAWRCGSGLYAYRKNGRLSIFMHKQITGFAMTDHVDGNGLNNRRRNLRKTNKSLNGLNTVKRPGSVSRFRGVGWSTRDSKWWAYCRRHEVIDAERRGKGRTLNLGSFPTELEAARAYDDAVRLRYGPLGVYNFPLPGERSALTGEVEA